MIIFRSAIFNPAAKMWSGLYKLHSGICFFFSLYQQSRYWHMLTGTSCPKSPQVTNSWNQLQHHLSKDDNVTKPLPPNSLSQVLTSHSHTKRENKVWWSPLTKWLLRVYFRSFFNLLCEFLYPALTQVSFLKIK